MVAGIVGQLFLHVAFNWTAGSTSTLEAAQCSTPKGPSQRSHAMPQMGATLNLVFAGTHHAGTFTSINRNQMVS